MKLAQGGSDWSRSRDSHLESSLAEFGQENVSTPLPRGPTCTAPNPLLQAGLPKGGGFLPRPPRPGGPRSRLVTGRHRGSPPGAAAPLLPLFWARRTREQEEA